MSDIAALVADNLDIWTGAIERKSGAGRGGGGKRISLYGIERLRALILDLAVSGKLAPQDPADEPAGELLKRIPADWVASKRRNRSTARPVNATEGPIVPVGWIAIPGNTIFRTRSGNSKLIKGKLHAEDGPERYQGYSASGQDVWLDSWEHEGVAIILSAVGARCGKAFLARGKWSAVANTHIIWLKEDVTDAEFAMLVLNNEDFWDRAGGAQPFVKVGNTLDRDFLLPPLAEQRRIVAKVDELMALCDALERESADAMAAHQTLVEELLGTLVNSESAADLAANWSRLENHFDTLFTTEASIDALKQTILDLAVRGRLVEQDAGDEAASALVKKITKVREALVATRDAKRLKKDKVIIASETDFSIPREWEWARLEHIALVGTGATPSRDRKDYYFPPEYNWVTSGETSQDFIRFTGEKISRLAIDETNVSICPPGTLIVAMYGQGKTRGQISELLVAAGTNQACATIQLVEKSEHHRRYVKLFFQMAYVAIRRKSAGGAQPNLNVGKIAELPIPIPPLAEQYRIVAKVDALMVLCDTLNASIAEAAKTRCHLADAITERAVA